MNLSPIFSSVFGVYQLLMAISGLLAAKCSVYVHQLGINCICLLFGVKPVVYSWFLELFI